MSRRGRLIVFLIGAVGLALMWAAASIRLPGPADLRDRYLRGLDGRTFAERNITDVVSAVNFDYRAFDTVGEEFILFASVMGSLALLKQAVEKKRRPLIDALSPSRDVGPSDAVKLWLMLSVGPTIAFGIYVITHGQLTPGGGFQGGVVLASAAFVIYLGYDFPTFKRIMSHDMLDIVKACGAGGFVLIGLIALIYGLPYLTNTLPLGKSHELTSGGTIPLISGAVGLEVTAGFVLLMYAFLQETLNIEEDHAD
jgi:multicomponent Na+:H+ antiporter subunit B